jgi:type I restriction enzyme S subunit
MSSKDGKRKRPLVPRLRFPKFREAGEWRKERLGTLAELHKGKGISKDDVVANGVRPCIRYGELYMIYGEMIKETVSRINVDENQLFLSKKNDVIIPASGETKVDIAKASCVMINNVALGSDINVLRSDQNGVFLSYQLNGPLRLSIAKLAQGDAVVHLYRSQLDKLDILVPSLAEQRRIADCLSSLDERITLEAQKLEALKRHKKGLMQQLFPREGETLPRLRFPEFREAGEWEVKSFIEIGNIVTGKTPSTADDSLWNGDIQFVTPTDISEEKYQWKTQRKVVGNSKINVLPKYSIMFTCIASIGKISLSINPCVTNQQINTIIPNKKYENEFIYYSLLHIVPAIKRMQASSSFPIINKTEFSSRTILVPQSYSEQEKIADCLSSLDELIAAEAKKLDTLKSHKKGLIQQIFPVLEDQG